MKKLIVLLFLTSCNLQKENTDLQLNRILDGVYLHDTRVDLCYFEPTYGYNMSPVLIPCTSKVLAMSKEIP